MHTGLRPARLLRSEVAPEAIVGTTRSSDDEPRQPGASPVLCLVLDRCRRARLLQTAAACICAARCLRRRSLRRCRPAPPPRANGTGEIRVGDMLRVYLDEDETPEGDSLVSGAAAASRLRVEAIWKELEARQRRGQTVKGEHARRCRPASCCLPAPACGGRPLDHEWSFLDHEWSFLDHECCPVQAHRFPPPSPPAPTIRPHTEPPGQRLLCGHCRPGGLLPGHLLHAADGAPGGRAAGVQGKQHSRWQGAGAGSRGHGQELSS